MSQTNLDCRGLRCPMPIVRLSQAMRALDSGDQLIVEATDLAFHPDLLAWAKQSGNQVLRFEREADGILQRAVVAKGGK